MPTYDPKATEAAFNAANKAIVALGGKAEAGVGTGFAGTPPAPAKMPAPGTPGGAPSTTPITTSYQDVNQPMPQYGKGGGPGTPGTQTPGQSTPQTTSQLHGTTSGQPGSYQQAMSNLTPTANPTPSDFMTELKKNMEPWLQAISSAGTSAEQGVYERTAQQQAAMAHEMGSQGAAGQAGAIAGQAQLATSQNQQLAQVKQAQADSLGKIYQFLGTESWKQYSEAKSQNIEISGQYINMMNGMRDNTIKGLAQNGIYTAPDLQQKHPEAYMQLLQEFNNDPAALDSALTLATPVGKIQQTWMNGSKYYQLVTDPLTNQPKVQSLDMGFTPPTTWKETKIGTSGVFMQDPNDPKNSITMKADFYGNVSYSGTGTGDDLAKGYNQQMEASGGTPQTPPQPGGDIQSTFGTGTSTVSQILGVTDPAVPLADVITQKGIDAVAQAMVRNEGGSPSGVKNNPGNIKYAGLPGQTDSGVKAADGGTFASYATPEAGMQQVKDIAIHAASGMSTAYGSNPTLASFVGKYTNTAPKDTPPSQSSIGTQYGKLASVPGFNPQASKRDENAWAIIKATMNGVTPTATKVLGSARANAAGVWNDAQKRADEVYAQATGGKALPNPVDLAQNQKILAINKTKANTLATQANTVESNFGLSLKNLDASNINQAAPAINNLWNWFQTNWGADPETAQYLSQNTTLQNEMSALLSASTATRGATVHDKLEAKDLIPSGFSVDQQKSVLNILVKEAKNAQGAVALQNVKLYEQIDPLGLNQENPLNTHLVLQDINTGNEITVPPGGIGYDDLSDALSKGWVMK